MKIKNLKFKNFTSYGNSFSEIDFDSENSFNILYAKNGHGKCVRFNTEIEIEFEDKDLELKFKEFLNKN